MVLSKIMGQTNNKGQTRILLVNQEKISQGFFN